MHRVVVTGLGVTCALGADVESFWAGLVSTASGAREIDVEGVGTIAAFPARDPDDAAKEHFGARESRRMDRVGRFAALAGAEALRSGGAPDVRPEQIGASLEETFGFLFDQLQVGDTATIVSQYISAPALRHAALGKVAAVAEDDPDAGE